MEATVVDACAYPMLVYILRANSGKTAEKRLRTNECDACAEDE